MVGIMKYHGDPNLNNSDPVFFLITANSQLKQLLLLPYFTKYGNTPQSTTDFSTVMLQLYQAGMWCWNEGGWPVISDDGTKPKINLPFWMDECWNGTNLVNYVDANNTVGTITVGGANSPGRFNNPWIGTFDYDSTATITFVTDLAISEQLTIEYAGLKNGTGNRYICDGRNDGGQWFLTDYAGYNWNWANQLQWNGNDPTIRHHCVATADASQNISRLYIGDTNGYGQVATGTANTSLTTVGADFTIGTRFTLNSTWNDQMSFFRVWDITVSDIQAEILYLHSKASISY